MTLLETRIASLWLDGRNTNDIAEILGMKESSVDRLRPAQLARSLKAVAREAAR